LRRARTWPLFGALIAFCFAGPLLWRLDPLAVDSSHVLAPPSAAHWLGTDALGRDELARVMQGGATTLSVASTAAVLAFLLGSAYGFAASLGPAWLDRALMRLLDTILALPSLVALICAAALLPPNDASLALLIGLVSWPPLARLVRNEARALRNRDFVLVAEQLGAGPLALATRQLLPVMGRLLAVNATFLLGDAILALSSLSFLGLAIQPPRPSWGELLEEGMALVTLHAWWLLLPPSLLITASLFAANALGGALLRGRQ
jgi:peptide/nickel transport system permease protein